LFPVLNKEHKNDRNEGVIFMYKAKDKKRVDIVIVVPVGLESEMHLMKEMIKDLECYYEKSYHIIFIDDTEDFRLKDFQGKEYTTIWSGCQGIRKNIHEGLLEREKTIFFTVTTGLMYAFRNFDFDFLQYMETDCAIINPGLDEWLYEMQEKYKFDLLGPLDDAGKIYESVINIDRYCEILPCFNEQDNIVYLLNDDHTYKYPVMFFANHFYSYRMIKKLIELDEKYSFLKSRKLMSTCNTVSTEPHFTTVIRLLGGRIIFYGGMDQEGPSGSAKPPLLSFHPCYEKKHVLLDTIKEFKIVHSIKSFSGFSFEDVRKILSQIRDEREKGMKSIGSELMQRIIEQAEKGKYADCWTSKKYRQSELSFKISKVIKELNPSGKVLDIGCGNGYAVSKLIKVGIRAYGVDITKSAWMSESEVNPLTSIQRDNLTESPIWDMPYKENEFDISYSTTVLEYIPENMVEKTISEILRVTEHKTIHYVDVDKEQEQFGHKLHLMVKPINWWEEKFEKMNHNNVKIIIRNKRELMHIQPQPWSCQWIFKKILLVVKERRLPDVIWVVRNYLNNKFVRRDLK